MGKKFLISLLSVGTILFLTACGSKTTGPFTMTCTGKIDDSMSKQTGTTIYNFDKNQYVTSYEVNTITVYEDEETYKLYKESSEETVNNNTSSQITYTIDSDDATKTLTFGYKITVNSEDLKSSEDKDFYKAVSVLKRAESNDLTCTFDGIEKSDIK